MTLRAFDEALNFDPAFSLQAFNVGVTVNPQPNATEFDLWVSAFLRSKHVLSKLSLQTAAEQAQRPRKRRQPFVRKPTIPTVLYSVLTRLSRTDAYFGDARVFNETIFESTMKWWTASHLNVTMLVNSKIARQLESRRDNPTYTYTEMMQGVSTGEIASLFAAFGIQNRTLVDSSWLEYWFSMLRACLPLKRVPG